jgi:tetratricopeptide (TPR) repeat protein
MKKTIVIPLLVVSCALMMGLKTVTDKVPRLKIPGDSLIYIPSGKYLKVATFGFSSLAADLVYIWSIQYYSDYSIAERYDHLDHIFSVISELDPLYLDPYEMGALIAVYEAKDPYLAFKVLDRGLEKNPEQWIFPYQEGHYAATMLKDYDLAREFYKKAMEVKGAPPIVKRLYADSAFKGMDYQTAWQNWQEIYRSSDDERIKKIASNHLYKVKSAMDIDRIEKAIGKYRQRFGRLPTDLSQLVREGFIASLPQDLDGNDYLYDPDTGEVKSPTEWWKR